MCEFVNGRITNDNMCCNCLNAKQTNKQEMNETRRKGENDETNNNNYEFE